MKARPRVVLVGLAGLAILTGLLAGGLDGDPGPLAGPRLLAQASGPGPAPVYKPPLRGAPGGRIGGGTRGTDHQSLVLAALAPDHTGLTTQEQPALFWFLSAPTTLRVEFTLNDPRATRPLLEVQLSSSASAGVQRLRLADHGVRLEPGVRYQWFVAAVADSERRSRDVLAGGTIERAEAPAALTDRLRTASASELPTLYADAGFWYDCIAALSDLIDARPADVALRTQRAALLKQVGLKDVAEYDLKQGG